MDIIFKNEVVVLEDKESYFRNIRKKILTEFKNSIYSEIYYPDFKHCFDLTELESHLVSNHKSRCLIFDRNLDETKIEQFDGDKSIEIMRKYSPNSLIYSISAYNGSHLPSYVKYFSKEPGNFTKLAKDYIEELENNFKKEEITIGTRLVLVDYLQAKIDKIDTNNIVLECYSKDSVHYLDFSPKQFRKIHNDNLVLGTSVELRILEDEFGNRINDIILAESSFGFVDYLKKDAFFASIPDYNVDDIMNDLIVEDE